MAIDLQPMAPIEGVIQVQGDITNARTAEVVCSSFSLVLCYLLWIYQLNSEDKFHAIYVQDIYWKLKCKLLHDCIP